MFRLSIRNTQPDHADEAAFGYRRPVDAPFPMPDGTEMSVDDQLTAYRLQAETEFPATEGYVITLEVLVQQGETSQWVEVPDTTTAPVIPGTQE